MKILVHDYSGHAFPIQLSRWLASAGHEVIHAYSADVEAPRGALSPRQEDPGRLSIRGLTTGRPLNKYNIVKRVVQERAYGQILRRLIRDSAPDTVLCGNTPPAILRQALQGARSTDARFVSWVQDIYSFAFDAYIGGKLGSLGKAAGHHIRRREFGAFADSDAAVVISEDFVPLLAANGVAPDRIHVIENWAPLEDMPRRPRNNAWATENGLTDKFVFLYSGTLGLKHNPSLLSALAERFRNRPEVRVVVVSQGLGRKWLEAEKAEKGLENLLLFDYVPFEQLPDVLASADVLVAILEPGAGILSVPSKVLSYLCVGRPILGAIPNENLASAIITEAGAGYICPPNDIPNLISLARSLYQDSKARKNLGRTAYAYARKKFNIETVGNRFLKLFR